MGQKSQLFMELMVALLHNPKILFLDEPTIGLDAIASRQVRSFLQKVNQERGTSIVLTSHYMEDIRLLCKRCVVINHGSKVYDITTVPVRRKIVPVRLFVPSRLCTIGAIGDIKFQPQAER